MKLGISLNIDVTKIDKSKIFVGKKGKYINLTTFIDTEEANEHGNHGFIAHSTTKEEREHGTKGTILGNSKIFYQEELQEEIQNIEAEQGYETEEVDDIPF